MLLIIHIGELSGKGDKQYVDDMDFVEEQAKTKLRSVLRSRSIKGYPLNIPFTDVDTILTQVPLHICFIY